MAYDAEFMASLRDISPYLPELPNQDAFETLDRAEEWEQRILHAQRSRPLVLSDYREGSARQPNELLVMRSSLEHPLVTAEHATDVIRKATGVMGPADHGTGAFAAMLAEDALATSVIPVGRQTGNAAVDTDHPIKQQMAQLFPGRPAYVSVHGMRSGKVTGLRDDREVHAIIGLGSTPSELSIERAERLKLAAHELGMRVIIGNQQRHHNINVETGELNRDSQGELQSASLAALGAGSTVNYAYQLMEQNEYSVPVMQLEMARVLRLIPGDMESGWHKDKTARAMGVYAGYQLVQRMVEIVNPQDSQDMVKSPHDR